MSKDIEKLKCPFLKTSFIESGDNTGNGYPLCWITEEKFLECIEEECVAFKGYLMPCKKPICALTTNNFLGKREK